MVWVINAELTGSIVGRGGDSSVGIVKLRLPLIWYRVGRTCMGSKSICECLQIFNK